MLRVVGAGFGRTGTVSLKLALEQLLGGPCYHMTEQINRHSDAAQWWAAVNGDSVDWPGFLNGWVATVDWPGCAVYAEVADAFPEAKVLLSTRDPQSWWESANRTIFPAARAIDDDNPFKPYLMALFAAVGVDMDDRQTSIDAFNDHNESVRNSVGADQLIDWQPGDGWGPLCEGLEMPEPDSPFPHANTSSGFRDMLDGARAGDVPRYSAPVQSDDPGPPTN